MRTHRHHFGIICLLLMAAGIFVSPAPTLAERGGRKFYIQHNLVSDSPGLAPRTDPNLVNPWGLAAGDDTALWVNDEATGVSTIYAGNGRPAPLVVTVPPAAGGRDPSSPTGIVYSEAGDTDPSAFVVSGPLGTAPSVFIFDTLGGTISGWNPTANRTASIVVVDNSNAGAAYTGLAIIDDHLFAANFGAGTVEIYDKSWQLVGTFTGPNIPAGYSPFGIQAINGEVFVAYSVKSGDDELPGEGLGIVDVFAEDGTFLRAFAEFGPLNAPWGMALAPRNFGVFSNAVLVGNFGDGRINAFNASTGEFLGPLMANRNEPIEIEGLWGIIFGNGDQSGKSNRLYFAAGINDEENGLLGWIGSRGNAQQ